jgi:hypothetical protein
MIGTDRDARQFVITSLDGRDNDFDIDRLINALHAEAGDWDFDAIPHDRYWEIVRQHDRALD